MASHPWPDLIPYRNTGPTTDAQLPRHGQTCAYRLQGRAIPVNMRGVNTNFDSHATCLYPNAIDYMESALVKMTAEERSKFFGGNAQRVYNLPK